MKTPKIIIIGQKGESEPKKPIEFVKGLLSDGTLGLIEVDKPTDYNYIELITRDYGDLKGKSFDLIFCYDKPDERQNGVLYLGYWNDGIVE